MVVISKMPPRFDGELDSVYSEGQLACDVPCIAMFGGYFLKLVR